MPRKKTDNSTPPSADRHKNAVVSFRPNVALRTVLQAVAKRERRSVAQVVQIYLERGLEDAGLWEPKSE